MVNSMEVIDVNTSHQILQCITNSNMEATWWHRDSGTILEPAESLGIHPEFGCRAGTRGAYVAKIVCGRMVDGEDEDEGGRGKDEI